MSVQYFFLNSSPAIAYSPLPMKKSGCGLFRSIGFRNKGLCKKTPNVPTERYANNKMLFATQEASRWDVLG